MPLTSIRADKVKRSSDGALQSRPKSKRGKDMNKPAVKPREHEQGEPLNSLSPYYRTSFGRAYLTDSLIGLRDIPDSSVNLVVTSPPYALHFKKAYGNVD